MTIRLLLLILALVAFTLAAFKVPAAVDWTNAGFALVVASWIA